MTRRDRNIIKCCDEIDSLSKKYAHGAVWTSKEFIDFINKQTKAIRRKIWRGKKVMPDDLKTHLKYYADMVEWKNKRII